MAKIDWPFGPADVVALTATGAQAINIENRMTIIDGVTVAATGNRTLNLTIDEEISIGAILVVKSKTASTERTIFGTGMSGVTITGVAGKTKVTTFVYDGTSFVEVATPIQID